jgi:hypothetical protein
MFSINFRRHKRKTEKAGKKAVSQKTENFRKNIPAVEIPENSNENLVANHKKI